MRRILYIVNLGKVQEILIIIAIIINSVLTEGI